MVNKVLDINRIEQGKLTLHEKQFDIGDLMAELNDMLEPMAVEKSMQPVRVSDKEVINRCIIGDYSRVIQIMINLGTAKCDRVYSARRFCRGQSVRRGKSGP